MADIIDKAIANKWNKSPLESQTWRQFEGLTENKQLVIYGIGRGAEYFLKYYSDKLQVAGAVDAAKYGISLSEYDFRTGDFKEQTVNIEQPSDIKKYKPDNTVILITALKNYMDIYDDLTELGYSDIYSFLCMEVNKRMEEAVITERTDPREEYISAQLRSATDYNSVFVETMGGYSGHARYIVEALSRKNSNLNFTWFNDGNTAYPDIGLNEVKENTKSYFHALYKAGFWLFEDPVGYALKKKSDQVLIQLKHWSSVTLKMFGIKLEEPLEQSLDETPGRMRRLFVHNAELTDYVISGSDFDEKTVKEGYLYDGPFFRAGSPRSDILFDSARFRTSIRATYGILENTKICLYVPTFRLVKSRKCRYKDTGIDFGELKDTLEKVSGENWVIMIRLHPRVDRDTIPVFPEYVIDATDYTDGEELVAASDAVIADYSSIMFEPAFAGIPVFLYAPDLEEYLREERGFLIPYEELPFPKAYSNEELLDHIACFDEKKYTEDVDAFMDKFGVHEDGHASERAADFILQLMEEKKRTND